MGGQAGLQAPVNLQQFLRSSNVSLTLEDIQSANRQNLALAQNKHVPKILAQNVSEPVKILDEEKAKQTLQHLNPQIDPEVLMKAILDSYGGAAASEAGGGLDRGALHQKLQSLLNSEGFAAAAPPAAQAAAGPSGCRGRLPVGVRIEELSPAAVQNLINAEVTEQLEILLAAGQTQGDASFETALVKAMENLQEIGFSSEQLSGASVQVPAPLMQQLGLVPAALPAEPPAAASPEGPSGGGEIDPRFSSVTHRHLSNLEIECHGPSGGITRNVEVIEIFREPSVKVMYDFLLPDECASLLESAAGRWQGNAPRPGGGGQSGDVTFARLDNNSPVAARIHHRISCLMQVEPAAVETLAIVKYADGVGIAGQHDGPSRKATIHVFLNDVATGGETDFVYLGFKVCCRVGTAVLWNNVTSDGEIDMRVTQTSLAPVGVPKYLLVGFSSTAAGV